MVIDRQFPGSVMQGMLVAIPLALLIWIAAAFIYLQLS